MTDNEIKCIQVGDFVLVDWSHLNIGYDTGMLRGWCEVVKIDGCMLNTICQLTCPGRITIKDKHNRERSSCWPYFRRGNGRWPFVDYIRAYDSDVDMAMSELFNIL